MPTDAVTISLTEDYGREWLRIKANYPPEVQRRIRAEMDAIQKSVFNREFRRLMDAARRKSGLKIPEMNALLGGSPKASSRFESLQRDAYNSKTEHVELFLTLFEHYSAKPFQRWRVAYEAINHGIASLACVSQPTELQGFEYMWISAAVPHLTELLDGIDSPNSESHAFLETFWAEQTKHRVFPIPIPEPSVRELTRVIRQFMARFTAAQTIRRRRLIGKESD